MRYFIGQRINGTVKEAAASTFTELVDRYFNTPRLINCSRAEYAAMDKTQKDEVKRVPYLTPACFSSSPSRRKSHAATHCNLIFLDIDPHKQSKGSPASLLLKNIDVLEDQLDPWAFAVHHTASSTPELPRLRVVVDADEIPLDRYGDAVKTIAKALGLPAVTTESMVPVQAMYLPSLFNDEDPEEYQPLIIARTTGEKFTVDDIQDSDVSTEARSPKSSKATSADGSIDALDFLRAPMDGVTLESVGEMLDSVDPDIEYREWLEVAASMRHQFTGEDEEEAYALFDSWSSKGNKYEGEDETRAKWDSFRPTPKGRVPVTIRSLMHRAALGGWDNSKQRETQFKIVSSHITKAESISDILEGGIVRIATTPMLSSAEEEGLMNQMIKALKARGLSVSIGTLKKDLRKVRETMQEKHGEKRASKENRPPWTRGLCYVAAVEKFFRHSTGETYSLQGYDNVFSKRLLPTEKQLDEAGIPVNIKTLSSPIVLPRHFALNVVKVPSVWDFNYDPGSPDEIYIIKQGKAYVNTYRKCYPHAKEEGSEEAGALFMLHLTNMIKEEDYRMIFLDWLAFMVQCPGEKIRWSPLLQGAEGCGKTYVSDAMTVVLGKPHVKPIGCAQLFSGYNEWSTGHQLVTIEEVHIAGHSRQEVMNVLKPLITNDVVPVNQKFRDSRHVENRTNYLLLTNHKNSLQITHESRRYFVLQSAIQTKEQVRKLNEGGYFEKLYAMLSTNANGLRYWFEQHEISPSFNPHGSAPGTTYLDDLVCDSANDVTAAVRRLIEEGDHPLVQADLVSSKVIMEMLRDSESIKNASEQHVAAVLRDEGYVRLGRHLVGEERHRLWRHTSAPERDFIQAAKKRVLGELTNLGLEMIL
jgi:hypothetical protein